MNEAVFDFCKATGIELTRSRAYKKNDQARVEQRNGAIARRLVGYGRLRGLEATETLPPCIKCRGCTSANRNLVS
jgi:hypothetical protein